MRSSLYLQGPNIIINQSKDLMDAMDPWCIKTHGDSGLTKSVLDSKVSEGECEQAMIDFIQKYTNKGQLSSEECQFNSLYATLNSL